MVLQNEALICLPKGSFDDCDVHVPLAVATEVAQRILSLREAFDGDRMIASLLISMVLELDLVKPVLNNNVIDSPDQADPLPSESLLTLTHVDRNVEAVTFQHAHLFLMKPCRCRILVVVR